MSRHSLWQAASAIALLGLAGCGATTETLRNDPGAGVLGYVQAGLPGEATQAVPDTVFFEFNSFALSETAKGKLDLQVEWIQSNPTARFSVTGHTDLVGNIDYNHALGLARAQTIVGYLTDRGIEEERLQTLVSMGEEDPLVATEDRERLNRRGTTEILTVLPPKKRRSVLDFFGFGTFDRDDEFAARLTPPDVPGQPASPQPLETAEVRDNAPSTPSAPTREETPDPASQPSSEPSSEPSSDSAPEAPGPSNDDDGDNDNNRGNGRDKSESPSQSKSNSGRGNGDELGDPGKSQGRNKGGDEVG